MLLIDFQTLQYTKLFTNGLLHSYRQAYEYFHRRLGLKNIFSIFALPKSLTGFKFLVSSLGFEFGIYLGFGALN